MAAVELLDGPANLGARLSAEHAAAPLSPVRVHARHFARDGRGAGGSLGFGQGCAEGFHRFAHEFEWNRFVVFARFEAFDLFAPKRISARLFQRLMISPEHQPQVFRLARLE